MNTMRASSSEEKSVELEEFIERISKIYSTDDTTNSLIFRNQYKTIIEYIRLLYRSDAKAKELIDNSDIHGLRFYLNSILAKYGDLSDICEYFKEGDLNSILASFTMMHENYGNISFKDWMQKKGFKINTYYKNSGETTDISTVINNYAHSRFLLKDYYEQVMRYDFSGLYGLCTRIDNLSIIDSLLEEYELNAGQMGK